MNILDVKDPEKIPENIMEAIFEKQKQLAVKYHKIESSNDLLQTEDFPVDLNDPRGQQRLKDMSWRAIEELGEASEALSGGSIEHYREELADALHFFVELMLTAGLTHKDMAEFPEPCEGQTLVDFGRCPQEELWLFTQDLGIAMNCLKNKPWKQTHVITDKEYFHKCLKTASRSFLKIFQISGFFETDMYRYYFKKNSVNQFRQRSNY